MRPNVKGRKNKRIRSIAFVLQKALACIQKAGFPAPSEKNVRDLLHKLMLPQPNINQPFWTNQRRLAAFKFLGMS